MYYVTLFVAICLPHLAIFTQLFWAIGLFLTACHTILGRGLREDKALSNIVIFAGNSRTTVQSFE